MAEASSEGIEVLIKELNENYMDNLIDFIEKNIFNKT